MEDLVKQEMAVDKTRADQMSESTEHPIQHE